MPACLEWLVKLDFGQIITWLIVLSGWYVINRQHNKREDRKETRTLLDNLKDRIYLIEDQAIEYHTSKDFSSKKSNKIKLSIQRITSDIQTHGLISNDEMGDAFKTLRKAITLNNFESVNHKALSEGSQTIQNIHNAIDDLCGLMEKRYRGKYPFLSK